MTGKGAHVIYSTYHTWRLEDHPKWKKTVFCDKKVALGYPIMPFVQTFWSGVILQLQWLPWRVMIVPVGNPHSSDVWCQLGLGHVTCSLLKSRWSWQFFSWDVQILALPHLIYLRNMMIFGGWSIENHGGSQISVSGAHFSTWYHGWAWKPRVGRKW